MFLVWFPALAVSFLVLAAPANSAAQAPSLPINEEFSFDGDPSKDCTKSCLSSLEIGSFVCERTGGKPVPGPFEPTIEYHSGYCVCTVSVGCFYPDRLPVLGAPG